MSKLKLNLSALRNKAQPPAAAEPSKVVAKPAPAVKEVVPEPPPPVKNVIVKPEQERIGTPLQSPTKIEVPKGVKTRQRRVIKDWRIKKYRCEWVMKPGHIVTVFDPDGKADEKLVQIGNSTRLYVQEDVLTEFTSTNLKG